MKKTLRENKLKLNINQNGDLNDWISCSYGRECWWPHLRAVGSDAEMVYATGNAQAIWLSNLPKIITGRSETGEHKKSHFTSHVIHLVCVSLHLAYCFLVFALLLRYPLKKRREGFMEMERLVWRGFSWWQGIIDHLMRNTNRRHKYSWNFYIQIRIIWLKHEALWGQNLYLFFFFLSKPKGSQMRT